MIFIVFSWWIINESEIHFETLKYLRPATHLAILYVYRGDRRKLPDVPVKAKPAIAISADRVDYVGYVA